MKLNSALFLSTIVYQVLFVILQDITPANAQQPAFELPVELVGFPLIIAAVRLSNFVKKLAYALNARTYIPRTRRSISSDDMIDVIEAEKRLVTELGDNVCIYTKVCLYHAEKSGKIEARRELLVDWEEIFSNYKVSKERQKEMYLLSVFLGDFIGSPQFCNKLAKRGRECEE